MLIYHLEITIGGSGWMEEELMTLGVHNDYNYMLPV